VKLCASLILRNELHRYLGPCIEHLLGFCDEVCILDNGSTDGWEETLRPGWGDDRARVIVTSDADADRQGRSLFVNHAHARQRLLDFTVARDPTHILAVDADEFIDDGAALRAACQTSRHDTLLVCLQEIWNVHSDRLEVRQDGGWDEHDVALVWRPNRIRNPHQIVDRGPATGRTPETLRRASRGHSCVSLLHFGWSNKAERADRYERYVIADGGRFHAGAHLRSIMFPDRKVRLTETVWPAALEPWQAEIVERAGEQVAA
jgi:glycosyltransferase involved in cell wall biosynthesis